VVRTKVSYGEMVGRTKLLSLSTIDHHHARAEMTLSCSGPPRPDHDDRQVLDSSRVARTDCTALLPGHTGWMAGRTSGERRIVGEQGTCT
jgi:hypothetical protein